MAKRYWYQGEYSTGGQKVTDLTMEEYINLVNMEAVYDKQKKEEAEKVKADQQELSAATSMAPAMNRGISDYVKEQGLGSTVAKNTESLPKAFQPSPETSFDNLVASKKTAASNLKSATNLSLPTDQTQQPVEQAPAQNIMSSSLLKGLPSEMVTPLIIQYQAGVSAEGKRYGPVQFFKDVQQLKATYQKIRDTETANDLASKRKIDETYEAERDKRATELATGEQQGEYTLKNTGLETASAERIAAMNIKAAKEKAESDAYNKRTASLKTPEADRIISLVNPIASLETVSNLLNKHLVGQAAGRLGKLKQVIGTMGGDETVFRSSIANLNNVTRNELFGAALTKAEMEQFKQEMLDPNVGIVQFKANLGRWTELLKNRLAVTIDVYDRIGRDVSKFGEYKRPLNTYGKDPEKNFYKMYESGIQAESANLDKMGVESEDDDDDEAIINNVVKSKAKSYEDFFTPSKGVK